MTLNKYSRWFAWAAAVFAAATTTWFAASQAAPLVSLEYKVTGVQLAVTPRALSVPKGIAGSVMVQVNTGGDEASHFALTNGAYVEAFLRGPNIDAHRVVGAANTPLLLPALNASGDYQLAGIRLVDAVTGATRLEGDPSAIPVHVFEDALVSKVTSRPLTSDEIKEKGIFIDENNFRAVEFEVGFVLDGKTIPVKFPVVAPTFTQSTEIIPAAELEAKLARAAEINQQIASEAQLPGELEQSNLNIQVQGINFQRVEDNEQDLALRIPPIPALMVIPGNIGYLNQFFSVQIFTENGAPVGSGLSVLNVQAQLILPPGPDRVPASSYETPGDDPVRFARIGPDKIIEPTQKIAALGPDGKAGTPDDVGRLFPGESGQAEFLVEGLQEGLHVLDLALTADLDGLAAGLVKVKGKAAGSVLVRNPKFSLAFTHPRTVRTGEPYEASATVLNTSLVPANQVRITLGGASLSGGVLESAETVELGDIPPGQSRTATWRVRAQRTGAISFSNLTTGDDSVIGRFRLKMGIDERGVALSPDTIGMPDYVNFLPTNIVKAATRVLGQSLSVATAPQLPAGIIKVQKSAITARVLDLAEAGQRLKYGDTKPRVLADLLLDWQGNRSFNAGFDQILRETDAGLEWREAMIGELEAADTLNASARLTNAAGDFAGRSEAFAVFATSEGEAEGNFTGKLVVNTNSANPGTLIYAAERGSWLVSPVGLAGKVTLRFTNEVAEATATALFVQTNGVAQQYQWAISNPNTNACYLFDYATPAELRLDVDCDGSADSTLMATVTAVNEKPPEVMAVLQDITVRSGRPPNPCFGGTNANYGTVVAVMFSKPMSQAQVNVVSAYRLDNGNTAQSVQIQQSARVALLNMKAPLAAIRPRTMTVSGISDARGNALVLAPRPVQSDVKNGVAIRGRVVRADGSFAANTPVTLTMYEEDMSGFECVPYIVRVAQVTSDENGLFDFDYVMAGVPYSISATDLGSLSDEARQVIIESSSADALNRQKLEELANSPSVKGSLLAAFAVGALPEAIAKAEGLDRALLRDLVARGSAREGTETIVALRFRGRGTVTGQVLGADGITAAAKVAVNLYPDPDSRELGRGVFSDENGRFAFYGVPLGVFSVQAQAPSGQFRTVADTLDVPGAVKSINIVLSTNAVTLTRVGGRVLEGDNITPHQGAQALVGRYGPDGRFGNVVAVATSDADGYWTAIDFPAGIYDIVAISADGKRKGERRDVPTAGGGSFVTLTLAGRATVFGRVETSTGAPVPNALVAGGEGIVRTDGNGIFTMPGVPIGLRTLSAGLERNPAAGIDFPRLGSGSVNVVPGSDNFVVIRLTPAGRIIGRVLDVVGQPVPNIRVAIPQENGFMWVETDSAGNYRFENLGLGGYTLSAPAGPVAQTDTSGLISKIRGGSEEEITAAINDAFAIFTGAADPYLNGEGANFNPKTWGFTKTALQFDGQTVVADIQFLREGTVSGTVLNSQGVPIGARVRLTGIGPLANGAPSMIIRGEMNTDPALGTFSFRSQALEGAWGLQVASPFYPTVITESGQITSTPPDPTNVVMRFPPANDVNGRLAGRVFMPDGTPASSNVAVKISFGNDYVIRTVAGGFFDTQIKLPAGGYSIEATDPETDFRGSASVNVLAGITNYCDVRLLGKGSLKVLVRHANGTPALNATVQVSQSGFPGDEAGGPAADGSITLANLTESPYSVAASFVSGPTTIYGRSAATVVRNQETVLMVTLAPTANVRGQFVLRDLVTPVAFAQVAIGNLGFAATGSDGRFELKGIPLGTYRLVTQDPVTGIGATATVTLTDNGQTVDVRLVEQARGEVQGSVISSYGTSFVPGATVTLTVHDGLTPARTVTTGPDGRFNFPGTPAGAFTVRAEDPITKLTGQTSAVLPERASAFEANIALQSLARMEVTVVGPDGTTPHTNASVTLQGGRLLQADVDANGRVTFVDLPLGSYTITAKSLTSIESRSFGVATAALSSAGETNIAKVRMNGVGKVTGRVVGSDGVTAVSAATVTLTTEASLFKGVTATEIADSNGIYTFENVPVGAYRVSATDQALGSSEDGSIGASGEVDTVNLTLGPSGTVTGRLVRASGVSAVGNIDVLITFTSQSGLPGRAFVRAAADGTFKFQNVPVGNLFVQADAPEFAGMIRASAVLAANGQTLALGDVAFDEDDPKVITVFPAHTAVEVPTTTKVDLYFNERLLPTSVTAGGVFLRTGTNLVSANLSILPDPTNGVPRLLRISPVAPLESLKTYEVVIIDGDRKDPFGVVTASGPTDLVGRPLVTPFVSRFSTADNAPPELVSTFPTNSAIQVELAAVPRFVFNEPIAPGAVVTLTGSEGTIAGAVNTALNGLSLVFTPNQLLKANSTYTLSASNVRDLAGNAALGQPFVATFTTLDLVGPQIAQLSIVSNRPPVASSTISVDATLAVAEAGASVRFSQDFTPIGAAVTPPYRFPVTLPARGSTTIRAIAIDQYNNEGTVKELVITVVSNEAPVINFARGNPPTGPVGNGQLFTLVVSATDDASVTNMNVRATGLFTINTNFNSGAQRSLALSVPADAPPGSTVEFRARAVDFLGLASTESVVTLQTIDTAPPALAIISPAAETLLNPEENLRMEIASADNGTNAHQIVVTIDSLSLTQTVEVAAAPNVRGTNVVLIPLAGAPKAPVPLTVSIRAIDGSSNAVTVTRTFRLPDREPPRVASILPQNGAVNQSLWTERAAFQFTERLDTNLLSTNIIVLTNEAALAIAYEVSASADGTFVFVRQPVPLRPAATYTNIILPGFKDVVGNALVMSDGTAWPEAGAAFTFRTAGIGQMSPTNGTTVVATRDFNVRVNFDSGLGADFVRFVLNTNPPVDVNLSGGATFAEAVLRASTNSTSGRIEISAHKNGFEPYAIGAIDIVVDPLPDVGPPPDGNKNRPPTIDEGATREFEIVQYTATNVLFTLRDADHNLRLARIDGATLATFYNLGYSLGSMAQVDFARVPVLTTNFTVINYPSTSAPLWPGGPSVFFAMVFRSTFVVTNEGAYTFYISSDDGSMLSVDGQRIIDNDGLHGMSEKSATVTLTPGVHSIEASMFENGGDHGVIVNWAGPDFGRQLMRFEGIQAYWADSRSVEYRTTNEIGVLTLPMTVVNAVSGTNLLQVVVLDHDSNAATQSVTIVTLPDLDRDAIADRDDADIDGDSVPNEVEVAQGTDPRNTDSDGDNIPDNLDARPLAPNQLPIASVNGVGVLAFDGANDFAEKRSPSAALNVGNASWTVSAWIRTAETNSRSMWIAGRYECGWNNCSSPDGNSSAYWALTLDMQGRATFSVRGTGEFITVIGTDNLRDGAWHHVSGVLDRSSSQLLVYVDGQLETSIPSGVVGPIQDAGSPFTVGRYFAEGWAAPGEYFNGWINGVRVWSIARTQTELASELTTPPAATEAGLVGYWPLNGRTATTATNIFADENHLTLGNTDAATRPQWAITFDQVGTADRVLALSGADPEGDPVTAIVTTLPAAGALYQTADGVSRGEQITAVPAPVANAQGKIIFAAPAGVNAPQYFTYKVSDGYALSADERVAFWPVPIPTFDTDGDMMPDVYEVRFGLNAEANDATGDLDGDRLANLAEYQRGSNPQEADTDMDGLVDGAEVAAGSDVFKRDTDSDGLSDGFDPQPLTVVAGLTFEGLNSVSLVEGDSTNIVIQVTSSDGHIAALDYLKDLEAPTFSALGGIQFTNTGANFMAWATLALNPLHDAAGEYNIQLRAASSDGKSGVFTIHVTVSENLGLAVTRWKDPVNGAWTDASRWTAGVPTGEHVAVIDAAGTYSVDMGATPVAKGIVLGSTNATLAFNVNAAWEFPAEVRAGTISFGGERTLHINKALVNRGLITMPSRSVNSYLRGTGLLQNSGRLNSYATGTLYGGGAHILLPITVTASGTIDLAPNGYMDLPWTVISGRTLVAPSAYIWLPNIDPTASITYLEGARTEGAGNIDFYGTSQLRVRGALVNVHRIDFYNMPTAEGPGRLVMHGNQQLRRAYNLPVEFAGGSTIGVDSAVFNSDLHIAPTAQVTVNVDRTLTINKILVNEGTIYMPSRNYHSYLDGAGWVDNRSEIRAYRVATLYDGYAHIQLPVHNAPTGKILLDADALMNFRNGSSLTNYGGMQLRTGSRLAFTHEGGGEMILKEGSQITGPGAFQIYQSNKLIVEASTTFTPHLELYNSSSVNGEGMLTLVGPQTLRGLYGAPIAFAPGSEISIDTATFTNVVTVETNALVHIQADRVLTVGSVLTNRGEIQMPTRNYHTYINGAGRIENFGLLRAYRTGTLYDGYAHIHVPIRVVSGGTILADENAFIQLRGGSSLDVSGTIDLRVGSRLLGANEDPPAFIRIREGGAIVGPGQLMLQGSSRLELNAPLTIGAHLELHNSATVSGDAALTLSGPQYLTRSYNAPLRIAAGAEVQIESAVFNAPVTIEPGASVSVNADRVMTINSTLTNSGTIHLPTRNYHTYVNGGGRIENLGVIRAYRAGTLYDGYAHFYLPVNVAASGKFLLDDNAYVNFRDGGELFISGELEIRDGSRLLFMNEGASRRLVFNAGAVNTGAGAIQIEGGNSIVATGDVTLTSPTYLFQSSYSEGPGVISLAANQTLYGVWRSPLTIVSNTTMQIENVTFAGHTLIEPTATLNINPERYLSFAGVTTNRGAINMHSRATQGYIYGGGRLVNEGVFTATGYAPLYNNNHARIFANIHVAEEGRFVAATNAIVTFGAGSSLSASGVVELQEGASITFLNEYPWRDFTLMDGGELAGAGVTVIAGDNRLVVEGDATFSGGELAMVNTSHIAGSGTLTIGTNAIVRFDHSANIDPNIEIAGTLAETANTVDLRFNNSLRLSEGGQLTLPGTASAVSFENDGGVLTGAVLVDATVPVTEWTSPMSGNWNNAANWSAGVPDPTKLAVITLAGAYTVTIDAPAAAFGIRVGTNSGTQTLQINQNLSVASLFAAGTNSVVELRGGTLSGNGLMRVAGVFNWIGGDIRGPGRLIAESTAAFNISGAGDRNFKRVFDNLGVVTWADGRIFANEGVINNRPGARWDAASDRAFYDGVFNNEGHFVKSAGSTDQTFFGNSANSNLRFNNSGTVTIQAGTMRFENASSHTGEVNIAAGARLWISGGGHTFGASSLLGGEGAFTVTSGSATILGEYSVTGALSLSGGTLDFSNGASDLPNFSFTGGTLAGSANVTVTTDMTWTGGTMAGSGALIIPSSKTLALSGPSDKSLSRVIENAGTIAFSEGRLLANGGVVNNRAGGIWQATGSTFFYDGVFNNEGSFIKLGDGLLTFANAYTSNLRFNNRGLADIQLGTVRFENGGAHTGIFQIATNAALVIAGGGHALSSTAAITGQGAFTASSGSISHVGAYTVTGATILSGASLAFESSAVNLPNFAQSSGALSGAATVTLTSDATWAGGTITGSGTLVIPSGVTLRVNSANDHNLSRVIENFGTIAWTEGRILANGGTINNYVGALWAISVDSFFYDGIVNNEGQITKTSALTSTFGNAYTGNLRLNNKGVLTIAEGVLRIENGGVHQGSFHVATNTTLYLAAGGHTFSTNSHLLGEGKLHVNGAGVTVLGEYTLTGGTILSGGTLDFSNGVTNKFANFEFNGGAFTGSADVVVTNNAVWNGGTMTGSGRFVVPADVEFKIAAANDHNLSRAFINRGTVNWISGRILANGATVENESGATWLLAGDSYFYDGVFNNAGSVIKTAAPANEATYFANAYTSNLRFNNSGLLRLDTGVVRFDNGGSHTGSFDLKPNTIVILNGGTHTLGSGSAITGEGEFRLLAGVLNADAAVTLPKFTMNNGTLTGAGDITLGADSTWAAGTVTGAGKLAIASGVKLTVHTGNDRSLSRVIENLGTLRWEGGRIMAHNGAVLNKSGAIWEILTDSYYYDGLIRNEGVIHRSAGGGDLLLDNYYAAVRLENAGVINVQTGTFRIRNSGEHSGIFQVGSGAAINFEVGTHTFADGSTFGGLGAIFVRTPIVLLADMPFSTATVIFDQQASIAGAFNISNDPGGAMLFAKSMNIPGSITVGGSIATGAANVSVLIAGDLVLLAGSLVENPGVIQAANVDDQGATIQGNAPIETPVAPSLRIDGLLVGGASGSGKLKTFPAAAEPSIGLVFTATTASRVIVESSTDLIRWTEVPCQVAPLAGGKFEARFSVANSPVCWFRLRQVP